MNPTQVLISPSENYQAPSLEVWEVSVEKGFAASDGTGTGKDFPWG